MYMGLFKKILFSKKYFVVCLVIFVLLMCSIFLFLSNRNYVEGATTTASKTTVPSLELNNAANKLTVSFFSDGQDIYKKYYNQDKEFTSFYNQSILPYGQSDNTNIENHNRTWRLNFSGISNDPINSSIHLIVKNKKFSSMHSGIPIQIEYTNELNKKTNFEIDNYLFYYAMNSTVVNPQLVYRSTNDNYKYKTKFPIDADGNVKYDFDDSITNIFVKSTDPNKPCLVDPNPIILDPNKHSIFFQNVKMPDDPTKKFGNSDYRTNSDMLYKQINKYGFIDVFIYGTAKDKQWYKSQPPPPPPTPTPTKKR